MNTQFFCDMGATLQRSMRHIFRSMDTIITVTITPIAIMLLFVYVLVVPSKPARHYVNFSCPASC